METVRSVDQVETILAELTFDEKLMLIRGEPDPDGMATGYIDGVDRLGLPPLRMVDGPMGIRAGVATAFPATIALGATWDRDLAERMGAALAREARAKGQDVLLGPGLNIIRVPTSGRNFEYISEDPLLTGELGVGYVDGVESQDVVATPKHFVANNQETKRSTIDVDVDERTLRELYLAPFRRVEADANPGAVMAAYNRVQGTHMTAHERLLSDVLDGEWAFDGVTVSDWWATHDAAGSLSAGLDVEMPGVNAIEWLAPSNWAARTVRNLALSRRLGIDPSILQRVYERFLARPGQPDPFGSAVFGDPLREAIESGEVSPDRLDEAVRAVLGTYEQLGILDGGRDPIDGDRGAHGELAREIATRGTVILKNDGTLPLAGSNIAVVGPNANRAKVGGGGSSSVTPPTSTSILEGIRERVPGRVTFKPGLHPVEEHWPLGIPFKGKILPRLGLSHSFNDAVRVAADADVAVVVVQDAATEGQDRNSMSLPGEQDRLVSAVADVNDNTVVVSQTSGPIEMPWIYDVAAVLQCWYPGQAGGEAVADVLFGTDPGGRLPVTFGKTFEDYPVAEQRRYPGVDGTVHYEEGVFVGYRHFDDGGPSPQFPFGHGHSYADFEYEDVHVDRTASGATISVSLTTVAARRGREVIQAYVSPPQGPVDRPDRTLADFASVSLGPGERRTVDLSLEERDLGRYDATNGDWIVDPGEYEIAVGRSSRDRRERTAIDW